MSLTKNQLKFLRSQCHDLKAVIWMGQKGLTAEVLSELEIALDRHELVKIKLGTDDREQRQALMDDICEQSSSLKIQSIGKTVSIYRQNTKNSVVELPKK